MGRSVLGIHGRRGFFRRPWAVWVTAVLVLWASPIRGAYGDHDSLREEEVKAAFVFNFLKFVEWPEERDGRSVVILCVLATSPLVDALVALDGKEIRGRPLRVEISGKPADLLQCHAVFLGSGVPTEKIAAVLESLRGHPVLTLGDAPGFSVQGGMIGLFKEGNKMRFNINLKEARAVRVKISSKLLQLARHVIE